MTPFIQQLVARPLFTVQSLSPVGDVIKLLSQHNIGAIVVVNNKNVLRGIISERDIVRRLNFSEHITELTASDLMTRDVISVDTSTSSSELMRIMTENKCRHLPILSDGKLAGIVSIGDVVRRLLENYQTEVDHMRSFINS